MRTEIGRRSGMQFYSDRQPSLLEYGVKKERLLLNRNESVNKLNLTDLIANGIL